MADKILYVQSAFKHGYTQDDIERAIRTKIYDGLLWGEDDIYAVIDERSEVAAVLART